MHPEPIRHHYIPQFILKNFCFEERRLYYFDKQTSCVSIKDTRDVFMARNLYRDEINYAADPVKIEKDLAEYEREIAQIIRERFLDGREIFITPQEDAKLKLFFAIMGFRSLNAKSSFDNTYSQHTKAYCKSYQPDGNTLDFWKRNLGYIVRCRSFEEVWDHPQIDDPIKVFSHRDTVGYFGKYIAIAEANMPNSFLIGDTYPVAVSGVLPNGLLMPMYDIFPISPQRVLFMASNGVQGTPRDVLLLREFLFQPPKYDESANLLRIRVKKLSIDEVHYLNKEIVKSAKLGVATQQLPSSVIPALFAPG